MEHRHTHLCVSRSTQAASRCPNLVFLAARHRCGCILVSLRLSQRSPRCLSTQTKTLSLTVSHAQLGVTGYSPPFLGR